MGCSSRIFYTHRLVRIASFFAAARWPIRLVEGAYDFDVLQWLLGLGGDAQTFPLMDVVCSDSDEIDSTIDRVRNSLMLPCPAAASWSRVSSHAPAAKTTLVQSPDCAGVRFASFVAGRLADIATPDRELESHFVDWLLQLDWFELAVSGDQGSRIFTSLADLAASRYKTVNGFDELFSGSHCDDRNSGGDDEYIAGVHRSLRSIESMALENNEFTWATFFARHRRQEPFCVIGVAALFLFAADITSYAAAAVGGEHTMRLQRALLFGQAIIRDYVQSAPPTQRTSRFLEVLYTKWPIWELLRSVSADQTAGGSAYARLRSGAAPQATQGRPAKFYPGRPLNDQGDTYLSIIVQGRNDNYGGDMLTRLNRMLMTSTLLLHEARLPSEIIIVEWNPPLHTAPLADVIERAPGSDGTVAIRVIRVPPAVHMSLPHHKAHPIFEHIAENVAFRRARGKFVLKTNIDNILSPDTILFLARTKLEEDAVYRATYLEFDSTVSESEGLPPQAFLEWLFGQPALLTSANLQLTELNSLYPEDTPVCLEGHIESVLSPVHLDGSPSQLRPFYWPGSGDFVLASRSLVNHVHGYPQIAQNYQTDDLIHCRMRAAGARQIVLQPPCVTVHQNHRRINRVRASTRWVVTDSNFEAVCTSPFEPLPTETGLGDDWGFAGHDFQEFHV